MPERTPGSGSLIVGGVPFTHNIVLPGAGPTMPLYPPVAGGGICQAALRDLALAFPAGPAGVTVADLGCLDGGYTAAFAQAGYDVTGIDARAENIAHTRFVLDVLGLKAGLLQADVRDVFTLPDTWDAVFCCGVLYHLDNPVAFLGQLGRAVRRLLIVQTHYSTKPDSENEGRPGHWYPEGDAREASWLNDRSFWLTRKHLMAAIRDAGFNLVFDQADYKADITADGYEGPDERGMFLGLKI